MRSTVGGGCQSARVAGIDWNYFGAQGGDPIERFVSACLHRRYGDTRRVQPAQGDGGIDIERDVPEGLVVWQVKRFTTPLSTGQRRQVAASWERFRREHVVQGERIARYSLVTPWNPTNSSRQWFAELVGDQQFDVRWKGEPFFDGLAADFPEIVALFTRGPGAFDDQLIAKALVAGSSVETGPPETMLEALDKRMRAVRAIRDQQDPNYIINVSERTSVTEGRPPLPHPDDAGAQHQYTYLGDNRWSIASVVPRTADSGRLDPITLRVRFIVDENSPDAKKVRDFELWGVPFEDVEAETWTTGGPLADPEPTRGLLSFGAPRTTGSLPDVSLRVTSASGETRADIPLEISEVTHGTRGDGLRFIARSRTGAVEIEVRTGSEAADSSIEVRFPATPGRTPASVMRDLEWIAHLQKGDVAMIGVDGHDRGYTMGGLQSPTGAMLSLRIARALTKLGPHTSELFFMPDVREVTSHQLERAEYLADIHGGQPFVSTWERLSFVVGEADPRFEEALRKPPAVIAEREQPEFKLGASHYLVTREMVTQFLSPRLSTADNARSLLAGDEVELVPGDDNRVIAAVIVDSEP